MDFNKMAVEHYTNESGVIFGSRDDHASLAALLQRVAAQAVERTWNEAADRLMETARSYGVYKYTVSGGRFGNVSRLFVLENDWMREKAQQAHKEQE